jgi:hypothetical protein
VWALSPKGTASVVCEADTPEAIAATWDTHDNILVAQLHNKFARIDMRKAAEKDKKRAVDKLDIGSGDEVGVGDTWREVILQLLPADGMWQLYSANPVTHVRTLRVPCKKLG